MEGLYVTRAKIGAGTTDIIMNLMIFLHDRQVLGYTVITVINKPSIKLISSVRIHDSTMLVYNRVLKVSIEKIY